MILLNINNVVTYWKQVWHLSYSAISDFSVKAELLFRYHVYMHFAWKARSRNDLYCVGWDVKPYSLAH